MVSSIFSMNVTDGFDFDDKIRWLCCEIMFKVFLSLYHKINKDKEVVICVAFAVVFRSSFKKANYSNIKSYPSLGNSNFKYLKFHTDFLRKL